MDLEKLRLDLCFLLSFLLVILMPVLIPSLKITFFAPFLIITIYKNPLQHVLWWAFLCGTIIDLFSSGTRLGWYATIYVLTTYSLYFQRKNFFADSITTLPIMVGAFSLIAKILDACSVYFFIAPSLFSFTTLLFHFFLGVLLDLSYVAVCFLLPNHFFGRRIKKGAEYFS